VKAGKISGPVCHPEQCHAELVEALSKGGRRTLTAVRQACRSSYSKIKEGQS